MAFCCKPPRSRGAFIQQHAEHTDVQRVRLKNTSNKERVYRQAGRQAGRQAMWVQWEAGGKVCHKITCIHALAIRAAAAVPEQSPPAAQLWGATPESPYWSRGWAETHFLWAQVTWYKAERVETGSGENKGRGQRWGGGHVRDQVWGE